MRILILDIETAPNLAHVWGLWKQNVAINQIIEPGYVLSWAAKWYGEDEVSFSSIHHEDKLAMLIRIWNMIDEADAIVHFNGCRFDMPTLNREFLIHHMQPPSPYKHIDLLKTVKTQFSFPSNKLDYVSRVLKIGKKIKHYGHELWVECMADDAASWEIMREYNINDVLLTEKLYKRLLPWIKAHPNHNLFTDDDVTVCTNCGHTKLHSKGQVYTNAGIYQRYKCTKCGANMRGRTTMIPKAMKNNVVLGAH